MSEGKNPESLEDFDARLRKAKAEQSPAERDGILKEPMSGFGAAFRIGVELVAGLIVGVGIGLLLDKWLDTTPWFLVAFFFVGAGAGILNVYRAASGIGLAPGYGEAPSKGPEAVENEATDDEG